MIVCGFVSAAPLTVFEDEFSSDHPLDSGWEGTYLDDPFTEDLYDDIFTDNQIAYAISDYYMGLTDNTAVYTSIDTTGVDNVFVTYDRRMVFNTLASNDELHVAYRVGDNGNWTHLETVDSELWDTGLFALPAGESVVQLRFHFDSDQKNTTNIAIIDNVLVYGDDVGGPEFSNELRDPFYPTCSEKITICVDVTDPSGVDTNSVMIDGDAFGGAVAMTHTGGDTYCKEFGPDLFNATDGDGVKYAFKADDIHGNSGSTGVYLFKFDCLSPTPVLSCDVTSGDAPLTVTCEDLSTDTVDDALTREWSTGDNGSLSIIQVLYNAAGTFFITLTVTDDAGHSADTTQEITVTTNNNNNNGGGGGGGSGSGTTITRTNDDGGGSSIPVIDLTEDTDGSGDEGVLQTDLPTDTEETPVAEDDGGFFSFITGAFLNEEGTGLSNPGIVIILVLIALGAYFLYRGSKAA